LDKFPILGIDPGKTIGMCYATAEIDEETHAGIVYLSLFDISWPSDVDVLQGMFKRQDKRPSTVVIECFRLFPHKATALIGDDFIPSQVIGFLRIQCMDYSTLFVEQMSSIKAAWKAPALAAFGIDLKGVPHHSRDALIHVVHYLVEEAKRARKEKT
jgi:hypothetical protein